MSSHGKEARPGRCYCRVHDEGTSLNDIAKIIAALNHKILCLRNEVNAFKNVGANGEKRSSEESAHGHLSAPYYETEPDVSRRNTRLEGPLDPEAAVVHVIPFQRQSIINYQLREKVDGKILADILKNGVNGNLYSNLVYKELPKDRGKKVSSGVQCDLTRHKRIRYFFNWFKTELLFMKNIFSKRNKETGSHPKDNNRMSFDCEVAGNKGSLFMSRYPENSEDDEDFEEDNGIIDWTVEAVEIENEKNKDTLQKDEENGHLGLESWIMQRNRLTSNIHAKMEKICLYKSVKFHAKNVKRRLDACIAELNEIIEDVTLIFPTLNPSDGLKYSK
ncbi:uncharacterized protein LOC143212343 [Lasioglossum baleicum]|uniref:uncharacterized protein LOC143212343 n=1 Tax=Lasioglossum baleicum TaxID=434251 RepID=UPI003FCD3399